MNSYSISPDAGWENRRSPPTGTSGLNDEEYFEYIKDTCSRMEVLHHDLHKPKALAKVDIILVAGLGGHYLRTWQSEDDKTIWPRDLLRQHIGPEIEIRVYSFHYNTTLRGTTSKAGIREHANDMLTRLYDEREDDQYANLRMLLFIGHSLGGMIIKRAITAARENRKYRSIWEASIGVLFFATPHAGFDQNAWAAFATHVLKLDAPAPGIEPSDNMLQQLNLNSNALKYITQDFWSVQKDLGFVTFSEEEPLDGLEHLLVDQVYSLTSPHADEHQTISGDHITLCKFAKDEDDYFFPVAAGIKSLVRKTPKAIDKIGGKNKLALYSLCRDDFHSHFMDKKPTKGTCRWITKRPEIREWKKKKSKLPKLSVKGPSGCGKSFLAQQIIKEFPQDQVLHCFLDANAPERRDLDALLRATLQQALRLVPELVEKYLAEAFDKLPENEGWSLQMLQSIWPQVMAEVTDLEPLAMVVDGLDDLKQDCRAGFFDCLDNFEKTSQNAENLKMLMVSSEDQDLDAKMAERGFHHLTITPEDVREDIKKTAKGKLKACGKRLSRLYGGSPETLCESLVDISNGNHRWAAVALDEFSRNSRDAATPEELPQDLPGLYLRAVRKLTDAEQLVRQFIKQALVWACFHYEKLKDGEFNIGQALGITIEMAPSHDLEIASHEWKQFTHKNIKAKLKQHCGQMVEVRDGRLQLVHPTLKTQSSLQLLASDRICRELIPDEEAAHAILAEICIIYLTMPVFGDPGSGFDPERKDLWELKVRNRIKKHEFLRYAVLYWQAHLKDAGKAWSDSRYAKADQRRQWLDDIDTGYGKNWREVWWYLTQGPLRDYPHRIPESTENEAPDPQSESPAPGDKETLGMHHHLDDGSGATPEETQETTFKLDNQVSSEKQPDSPIYDHQESPPHHRQDSPAHGQQSSSTQNHHPQKVLVENTQVKKDESTLIVTHAQPETVFLDQSARQEIEERAVRDDADPIRTDMLLVEIHDDQIRDTTSTTLIQEVMNEKSTPTTTADLNVNTPLPLTHGESEIFIIDGRTGTEVKENQPIENEDIRSGMLLEETHHEASDKYIKRPTSTVLVEEASRNEESTRATNINLSFGLGGEISREKRSTVYSGHDQRGMAPGPVEPPVAQNSPNRAHDTVSIVSSSPSTVVLPTTRAATTDQHETTPDVLQPQMNLHLHHQHERSRPGTGQGGHSRMSQDTGKFSRAEDPNTRVELLYVYDREWDRTSTTSIRTAREMAREAPVETEEERRLRMKLGWRKRVKTATKVLWNEMTKTGEKELIDAEQKAVQIQEEKEKRKREKEKGKRRG